MNMDTPYPPNCLGFVIDILGLGPDRYYDPQTELDQYFVEAGSQRAEIAVARIGRLNMHVVLYDPNNPNTKDHRPGPGEPVVEDATFYDSIGKYQDAYPGITHPETMTNITFMRNKK